MALYITPSAPAAEPFLEVIEGNGLADHFDGLSIALLLLVTLRCFSAAYCRPLTGCFLYGGKFMRRRSS